MNSFDYQQYIDNAEKEIANVQNVFFAQWNEYIKTHFTVEKGFMIENYVDIYGGFFLKKEEFVEIDEELKRFYLKRLITDKERIFLRGYDYYFADPLVHLSCDRKNVDEMLKLLKDKWKSYGHNYTFSFLKNDRVSFENWIATLGFLEYILNDISSLQWFLHRQTEHWEKDTDDIFNKLSEGAEIIGQSIAQLLSFQYKKAYRVLTEGLESVLQNGFSGILHVLGMGASDWAAIRAIREGDSISLIYGAYITKLSAFFRDMHVDKCILLSNSFGAMNTGIILKYLLLEQEKIKVDSLNVLYMQNRAVEDEIYGSFQSENCSIIGGWTGEKYIATIIVDDSIFTGSSFLRLKEYVNSIGMCDNLVFLLPMTLNCDCLKYCRRGIKPTEDINAVVKRAVECSREMNDCLPPFTSFWDFSREAPENSIETVNEEVRCVLKGDDGLMKHIWGRFESEISKHCSASTAPFSHDYS